MLERLHEQTNGVHSSVCSIYKARKGYIYICFHDGNDSDFQFCSVGLLEEMAQPNFLSGSKIPGLVSTKF
jgi:hypothetical protein